MKHQNIDDLPRKHKRGAEDYEFIRRDFMKVHEANTLVRVYELPPGKSAYPYHYHLKNEETFFILRGEGLLPRGLDTADLMIVFLLLLMNKDDEGGISPVLTLALKFLL